MNRQLQFNLIDDTIVQYPDQFSEPQKRLVRNKARKVFVNDLMCNVPGILPGVHLSTEVYIQKINLFTLCQFSIPFTLDGACLLYRLFGAYSFSLVPSQSFKVKLFDHDMHGCYVIFYTNYAYRDRIASLLRSEFRPEKKNKILVISGHALKHLYN